MHIKQVCQFIKKISSTFLIIDRSYCKSPTHPHKKTKQLTLLYHPPFLSQSPLHTFSLNCNSHTTISTLTPSLPYFLFPTSYNLVLSISPTAHNTNQQSFPGYIESDYLLCTSYNCISGPFIWGMCAVESDFLCLVCSSSNLSSLKICRQAAINNANPTSSTSSFVM